VSGDQERRRRRAQLWALYFLLLALVDAPAFMLDWQAELGDHLDAEPGLERVADEGHRHLRVVE
jgi:hypothetical protein